MVNVASLVVALPLYSWPMPGAWDSVYDVVGNNSHVKFDIIINPSTGPGAFPPGQDYVAGVSKLNSYSNVDCYGYVPTGFADRSLSDIEGDIATYAQWGAYSGGNLHLAGIFLDEATNDLQKLSFMENVASTIQSTMPSGSKIWTNPGAIVDEAFYAHADVVNAFENDYEEWISPTREAIPWNLHSKSSVIITAFNGAAGDIPGQAQVIADRGFQSACLQGITSYQAFSWVWGSFAAAV